MTRAQRIWHARLWLALCVVLAGAVSAALVRRHETPSMQLGRPS